MKYYKTHRDELSHDDDEREDHKYVARVEIDNPKYKYRYFYTNPSYQAYLRSKNKVQTTKPVVNQPAEPPKSSNLFDNLLSSVTNIANNIIDTGRDYVENFIKPSSETVVSAKSSVLTGEKATIGAIDNISKDSIDKDPNYTSDFSRSVKSLVSNVIKGFLGKDAKAYDKIDEWDDLPKTTEKYTDEEDQAVINPDYNPDEYEYSMNCAYCTAAYELRQRGYDVEAAPVNRFTANTLDEIRSWYIGEEVVNFNCLDSDPSTWDYSTTEELYEKYYEARDAAVTKVTDQMKECGEGARGQFLVWWYSADGYGAGGHSMVWEVTNGEVIIRDAQTNQIYDLGNDIFDYATDGHFFRTDNLELDDDILKAVRQRF